MGHFAKIEHDIVTNVIVADLAHVNRIVGEWIETSYANSYRGNFAGIGYIYDRPHDVFYPPKPSEAATLNTTTWKWTEPVIVIGAKT